MAQGYKLFQKCESCKGTGHVMASVGGSGTEEISCTACDGQGFFFLGWCTGDLFDMPDLEE